mgnify:FL=1
MKKLVAVEMKRSEDPLLDALENGGSHPAAWDKR